LYLASSEIDKNRTIITNLERGKFIRKSEDIAKEYIRSQKTLLSKENISNISKAASIVIVEHDL